MANEKSERLRIESFFFECSRKLTGTFCAGLLPVRRGKNYAEKIRTLEKIVDILSDPDPTNSLAGSAQCPLASWQNPFSTRTLTPLEKWKRIRKASVAWPEEVRHSAKGLLAREQLPDWKQIKGHLKSLGFEPVPVLSRVDEPLYSYLIATGRIPINTRWAMHYRRTPQYALMLDTFHDLGHALALGMDDYREEFIHFSKAVLDLKADVVLGQKISSFYKRHFEYAYAIQEDGSAEPIGSVPFALQTIQFKQGKLWPVAQSPSELVYTVRPFSSRMEWRKETRKLILKMR